MGKTPVANKTAPAGTTESKETTGRKPVAVTLKGSPEWKAWLEGLSEHCRLDVAKVIDLALVDYAKRAGYDSPAPLR
jgi:hypothetical protein